MLPKKGPNRSMLIVGGIVALVLGGACACSNMSDDDCDSLEAPEKQVFAAGFSGLTAAVPDSLPDTTAVPANGGFGTHLASCGG